MDYFTADAVVMRTLRSLANKGYEVDYDEPISSVEHLHGFPRWDFVRALDYIEAWKHADTIENCKWMDQIGDDAMFMLIYRAYIVRTEFESSAPLIGVEMMYSDILLSIINSEEFIKYAKDFLDNSSSYSEAFSIISDMIYVRDKLIH